MFDKQNTVVSIFNFSSCLLVLLEVAAVTLFLVTLVLVTTVW